MFILLVTFAVLAAILMILVVLIQNSKGGGLASAFSSSNGLLGVRKTTDVLEKTTWTLAAVIVVLSIASSYTLTSINSGKGSVMEQDAAIQRAINPNNVQAFPAAQDQAPAAEAPAPAEAPAETPAPAAE